MTFRKFFETYGDQLFLGYQAAAEEGCDEDFSDWVLGEYQHYLWLKSKQQIEGCEKEEAYQVPYTG